MRRALLALVLAPGCVCGAPARSDLPELPAELSDAESLGHFADWSALPVFGEGVRRQQSSADRRTGDAPLMALWDHDNRDMNNFVCRSADADAPPSRVPFVFDEASCPPGVEGVVLSRFEGSGRLARIWMTAASFRDRPPDRELLRLYIDGAAPIELPLAAALDGSAGAPFAPPFGAGSTRRLAWYYPVVFGERLVVALDHLAGDDLYFHQTDVVLDEQPRPRRARAAPKERQAALRLLADAVPLAGSVHARHLSLAPGETAVAHDLRLGPATIVKLRVVLDDSMVARLDESRIVARWDDAAPAIDVPLADLFAASQALPEVSSHALAVDRRGATVDLSLQLPMPFRRRARWEISAPPQQALELDVILEVQSGVPSGAHGRLHVQRNETRGPTSERHHPLAKAEGRGRLVGSCVAMQGHGLVERGRPGHPLHFLEGDETALVDGETALSGTGTEDYFNGAFYFDDGPGATPFAQVWNLVRRLDAAPAQGQTSACRWHVLGDAIDFRRALELNLEIGPGVPAVLDRYTSVSFLYLE